MEPNIIVRRLVKGDGPHYRQIRLEALKETPESFGATYDQEVNRTDDEWENRIIKGCIFGAFLGDRIVGMSGFFQQSGPKLQHKGVLWGVYVDPDIRNLGSGSALVEAVLTHASDVVELISLAVVEENKAAQSLYLKSGFRAYGVEPRALKVGDRYFSEVLMVCEL